MEGAHPTARKVFNKAALVKTEWANTDLQEIQVRNQIKGGKCYFQF